MRRGLCLAVMLAVAMSAAVSWSQDEIRFGVIPLESKAIMFKHFMPLTKYLQEQTGTKFKLVIGKDYQDTMDALGSNDIQLAYLTPTTYPKSEKQNAAAGITPLVKFQSKGKAVYKSCIIVPADSSVTKVEELKGKKFAFGNADSTSSHLMPRSMLIAAGIDPDKDMAEVKHLDTHTNVAEAVSLGKFDGGGVKESVADKYAADGKVKILAKSGDIPQFPICINKHLAPELVAKIKTALLALNDGSDEDKAVLTAINKKFTGVEAAQRSDYDIIRDMIDKIYGDVFYERQ